MADRGLVVFLIAGEPSGDRLGGAVMAGLRRLAPGVRFSGVGGPEMVGALRGSFAGEHPNMKRLVVEIATRASLREPPVAVSRSE